MFPLEILLHICKFSPYLRYKFLLVSKHMRTIIQHYEDKLQDSSNDRKVEHHKERLRSYDPEFIWSNCLNPDKTFDKYELHTTETIHYIHKDESILHGEYKICAKTVVNFNSRKSTMSVMEAYHYRLHHKHGKFVINYHNTSFTGCIRYKEVIDKVTGSYHWNKLHGKVTVFHISDNGFRVVQEYMYDMGTLLSCTNFGFIGGKYVPHLTYKYKNNLIVSATQFHSNGQIEFSVPYQSGKEHGTQNYYDRDGNLVNRVEWFKGSTVVNSALS